jgi:hypothetical protein
MKDVLVLFLVVGFFAACVEYVRWCDRIIGPDPMDLGDEAEEATTVSPLERDAVAR